MMKTNEPVNQEHRILKIHLSLIVVFLLIGFTLGFPVNRINIPKDYATIQQGINAAQNGDTVIVQPGTYFENIDFIGKNIVVASLIVTTTNIDSFFSYLIRTVINGNKNGSVVTFKNGEDSTAKLIGFNLINGKGGGQFPQITGGGITCWNNSNPMIISNFISGCQSTYGGGFYCLDSSPTFSSCTIMLNSADGSGGGGVCYNSNPIFSYVLFILNTCTSYNGGGLYLYQSNAIFNNVVIQQNTGVYGGGLLMCESSPKINNSSINTNHGKNSGGGVHIYTNSHPDFTNTLITDNISDYEGGGIACEVNSSALFRNVTIANNVASTIGGGVSCYQNINLTFINSVIWGNQKNNISFWQSGTANTVNIAYSDLQEGQPGIQTNNNGMVNWLSGNISQDPLFVDASNSNFNLQNNSPCIDKGIPFFKYNSDTLVNMSRAEYYGPAPDIGAYEAGYNSDVETQKDYLINRFRLSQNYPNPFNATTTFSYRLPEESIVRLTIYDITGRLVETLVSEKQPAGYYHVSWDAGKVGSGVYIYRIDAGEFHDIKKCVVMK